MDVAPERGLSAQVRAASRAACRITLHRRIREKKLVYPLQPPRGLANQAAAPLEGVKCCLPVLGILGGSVHGSYCTFGICLR